MYDSLLMADVYGGIMMDTLRDSAMLFSVLGIVFPYVTMVTTLVIAAYLLSGVKAAKGFIGVLSSLQFIAVVLAFSENFFIFSIVGTSSIVFYIFMLILWLLCRAKEKQLTQGTYTELAAHKQATLNKAMYHYFVEETNKD